MIYVMSQKFFKKKIEKMAKYSSYFIIDGENFAVTGRSNTTVAIATKYNRSHSVGSLCPEMKLYKMLKKKKRGEEINDDKYEVEVKSFLKDKVFVSGINVCFKALVASGYNNPLNIFIVLPNVVYKYLGESIINRMKKISKTDFDFIFSQEKLKDNMKCLKKLLDQDELRKIDSISKKIEKKYDLKFTQMDDD